MIKLFLGRISVHIAIEGSVVKLMFKLCLSRETIGFYLVDVSLRSLFNRENFFN